MLLKDLLRFLSLHLASFARAMRGSSPVTRLRAFLSVLLHLRNSSHSHITIFSTTDDALSESSAAEACCSALPPSTSRTSLHIPGAASVNLALPPDESQPSSRAVSIRTDGSYRSIYGGEEMRIRARAISASQREERSVISQWTRVAVGSRPQSRASNVSAHSPVLSSPASLTQSVSPLPPPSGSRATTPPSLHPRQAMYARQDDLPSDNTFVGRSTAVPGTVSNVPASQNGNLTLEIDTVGLQIETPSQSTSRTSPRPHSFIHATVADQARADALQSSRMSVAEFDSPASVDVEGRTPPQLPQLTPGRWIVEITPQDLLWYTRRATT